MSVARRIIYLLLSLLLFQTPSGQNSPKDQRYISLYRQAEQLYYDDDTNDVKDSIALATYLKVIQLHPEKPDSILWDSYFKAGIYLQTAGRFNDAIPYFQKAVTLPGVLPEIHEHLLYLPNLYLGNSYYSASMLDSAVYFYKQAEQIAAKYPYIEGLERLYNTLGAVNYESGDYQQSRIYFEKALQVITERQPSNIALIVNYKNNLASALRQSKEYDKAMQIFNELLSYRINHDEILHNIGSIYLEQGKDSLAVRFLQKVRYNNQNKYNDLGIAYSRLNIMDSAFDYFRKAGELNYTVNGDRKNIQYAITCKNLGDYYAAADNYDSAVIQYQQSIKQLVYDFNEDDPRLNPADFNGQFSVMELFGAIAAKAKTFTLRYQQQHNKNDLVSSIYTYDALYKLADYVIRTYNSEEARLLLSNRKYMLHTEPIDNSLKLFELTGDSVFLRHAFRFDEKNKASLLALQLQETASKKKAHLPRELLEKEEKVKREITRLQLQVAESADSVQLAALQLALRDKHIELADVHKKFDEFPEYKNLKFIDNTIDVKSLQAVIPENYSVLSYHLGDTSMLAFCITKDSFSYYSHGIDSSFRNDVNELYNLVQLKDQNTGIRIDQLTSTLYARLMEPFMDAIDKTSHLMIIPDDELAYLPFEIMKSGKGDYLEKSHSITYNYSCSLLMTGEGSGKNTGILAMAPFVNTLPASEAEIRGIKGTKFIGKKATKEEFVRESPRYSMIHLATHASANDTDPSRSFIQFYAADTSDSRSRLFTPEIAELPLEHVRLVILSACETGTGQLIKGEGLMSLTRSFSYAGCRNIIASLWKADDKSTADISQRLHYYLGKGNSAAEALQKARVDYIEDDKTPARLKTPAYWAHLRLIGIFSTDDRKDHFNILIITAAIIMLAVIIYLSRRRS